MTEKKFEEYIKGISERFIPRLLLQNHTFSIKRGVTIEGSLFEAACNYPYLTVCIRYSEEAFQRWKKKVDLTPPIVHELCHALTDPLYCKANSRYVTEREVLDERERLTDLIANIVLHNANYRTR